MDVDWNLQLAEQFDLHWRASLRPRLDGLTDEEYFWEPVAGCWSVRRRGMSTAPIAVGAGEFTFEFAYPAPDPARSPRSPGGSRISSWDVSQIAPLRDLYRRHVR